MPFDRAKLMEVNSRAKEDQQAGFSSHWQDRWSSGIRTRDLLGGTDETPVRSAGLRAPRSARFAVTNGRARPDQAPANQHALDDALRRLEKLADASHENIRSFSWLLNAERELLDLRPKLMNLLSACAAEWSEVVEAEAAHRPDLVTWLERQFRRRVDHLAVLDHLFNEVRAAGLDDQPDLPAIAGRLKEWIHQERRLHADDTDYIFPFYWTDLGGEA